MTTVASFAAPEGRLARLAGGRSMLVAMIVAIAFFMEMLDSTIIVTALPAMAGDFGVDVARLSLGITVYMMAAAAFVTASGWLADRIGTRTLFCSAIGVFALASLVCGLARSFEVFVAGRALQGVAAAMMSPVGRLVVLRTSEKKDLMRALSTLIWPGLIAPVLGPPLGGWITDTLSWHWIFYINIPVALIGMVLVLMYVPQEKGERRPFDLVGFVLTAIALMSFTYGLDLLALRDGSGLVAGFALLGGALVLGAVALRHMSRANAPLVPLEALKVKSFFVSSVTGGIVSRATISATPFLLPLMFQLGFGLSATAAGGWMIAYMAANLGMKTITTPILKRFGIRPVLIGSSLLAGAAIAGCAFVDPHHQVVLTAALLAIAGATRSMQLTAVTMVNFADIAPPQRQPASVLSSLTQLIGMGAGVAVGAVLLMANQAYRGGEVLALADFRFALVAAGALAALAAVSYAGLAKDVGDEIAGRKAALA